MDFSDSFNDPDDSDVFLKFVPDDKTVGEADELQSIAEQQPPGSSSGANAVESTAMAGLSAVQSQSSSRKRGRSDDDDSAADDADPHPSRTLHLHKVILIRSEYFKARIKRWRPAAALSGEPSSESVPMLELVEKVPEGQLEAAELAIKCMYVREVPAKEAGNAMLLLHAYLLAERFDIPAACMDKIAAALSALRPEALTLDILQASTGTMHDLSSIPIFSQRAHAPLLECSVSTGGSLTGYHLPVGSLVVPTGSFGNIT